MKLDNHTKKAEPIKTEIIASAKKEVEFKLLGSMKQKKGHILFEINKKTLEIKPAKIEIETIVKFNSDINIPNKKKCIYKDGYFYITALNKKSVEKKLLKLIK